MKPQIGTIDITPRGEDILLTFVTAEAGYTRGPGMVGIVLDANEARAMIAKMEAILGERV